MLEEMYGDCVSVQVPPFGTEPGVLLQLRKKKKNTHSILAKFSKPTPQVEKKRS